MIRFTDGPADEMSILIACGVATYVIAFPIIILCAIVCGGMIRAAGSTAAAAAAGHAPAPQPVHPRSSAAPAAPAALVGAAA